MISRRGGCNWTCVDTAICMLPCKGYFELIYLHFSCNFLTQSVVSGRRVNNLYIFTSVISLFKFCLGVRYLATGANYSPLAATQGVSKSTVTRCLYDVLDYFNENYQKYILFPENDYEMMSVCEGWEDQITRLPRCLGAVDGTHIPILRPSVQEHAFVNRKGWHSLNVMVI